MTNSELYNIVDNETIIPKSVTDTFIEMDTTSSMTTQAELNKLLVTLYNRLLTETIMIEDIDETKFTTRNKFKHWIDNNINTYSRDLFYESIEK